MVYNVLGAFTKKKSLCQEGAIVKICLVIIAHVKVKKIQLQCFIIEFKHVDTFLLRLRFGSRYI